MKLDLRKALDWTPPPDAERIHVIDAHTAGEPLRIVIDGAPALEGSTVLEKRRWAGEKADRYRTALMWEPRGHADMYGCWIGPPERADSDFSIVFMHNAGYSTMCGHGIIAAATVVIETGMLDDVAPDDVAPDDVAPDGVSSEDVIPPVMPLRIDSPAGLILAEARVDPEGRVEAVSFRNVPSFAGDTGSVRVEPYGEVRYDLAYGGAWYAFVDSQAIGLELSPGNVDALIAAGRRIKAAIRDANPIEHPGEQDLAFLYGVIFTGPPEDSPIRHSRHVCVFADGEVDRSPTGTGVSARAALLAADGSLALQETIRVESILGTTFDVSIAELTRVAGIPAVVPVVEGSAFITGRSEFILDPRDPLVDGFILR